jgi:hypothetical protein
MDLSALSYSTLSEWYGNGGSGVCGRVESNCCALERVAISTETMRRRSVFILFGVDFLKMFLVKVRIYSGDEEN